MSTKRKTGPVGNGKHVLTMPYRLDGERKEGRYKTFLRVRYRGRMKLQVSQGPCRTCSHARKNHQKGKFCIRRGCEGCKAYQA